MVEVYRFQGFQKKETRGHHAYRLPEHEISISMYTGVAAKTPGQIQDETKAKSPAKGEKDDDDADRSKQEDR
jgi:hypothetical protein